MSGALTVGRGVVPGVCGAVSISSQSVDFSLNWNLLHELIDGNNLVILDLWVSIFLT